MSDHIIWCAAGAAVLYLVCEAHGEDCVPTGIVIKNTDCTVDETRP